jgi:hypothetical protein
VRRDSVLIRILGKGDRTNRSASSIAESGAGITEEEINRWRCAWSTVQHP